MLKITTAQVTFDDSHTFSTEASSLGLKPGEWPDEIELTDAQGRKTIFPVRMPHYALFTVDCDHDERELMSVRYFGPHMLIVELYND